MNSKRNLAGALALGAALVLGGCGGGDSGPSGGTTGSIPASATASLDGFTAYMKMLVAGSSETSSPVTLGDATAPASETATPVGL